MAHCRVARAAPYWSHEIGPSFSQVKQLRRSLLTKVVKSSPGVMMSGRKQRRCIPPLSKVLLPPRWWGLLLVLVASRGASAVSAPVTPIICSNMDVTLMSWGHSSIIRWLLLSLPWGAKHGLWSCLPKPWFNPIHNIYLPWSYCFAWIFHVKVLLSVNYTTKRLCSISLTEG